MTAGDVMDSAASLLNDTAKQTYTYVVQIPYLKMALKDLRKKMQLSNLPVTNETSAAITIPANTSVVSALTTPALPSGLTEIQQLWERPSGIGSYTPMTRMDFIPHYLEGVDITSFRVWVWKNNAVNFLPSNRPNDIKFDYIQELFGSVVDQNSTIDVINGDSYLFNRTAALCARFIGENKTRADELDGFALEAFEIMEGIESKAKQTIATRRKPFRSSYKSRVTS